MDSEEIRKRLKLAQSVQRDGMKMYDLHGRIDDEGLRLVAETDRNHRKYDLESVIAYSQRARRGMKRVEKILQGIVDEEQDIG